MSKIDSIHYLVEENRKLQERNERLVKACTKARLAFSTILDMGLMPNYSYDKDTMALIDEMHAAITDTEVDEAATTADAEKNP